MDFREIYFDQWKIVWNFHQKWYGNDGSDKTWDAIISEADELMKKSEFMKGLTLVVVDELDENYREKQKEGNK